MKKNVLTLMMVFSSVLIFAQSATDYIEVQRTALKAEKKAVVADAMAFTDAESEVFWPLYNEYNEKTYAQNSQLFNVIVDYATNYQTMTDEKALELWTTKEKIDAELSSLEKEYFKKFQKILPGKTVVKYFQVESKISMMINAELADLIPLVK